MIFRVCCARLSPALQRVPLLDNSQNRYGRHHSFHVHAHHLTFQRYPKRWVLLAIIVFLQISVAMVRYSTSFTAANTLAARHHVRAGD